MPLNNQKIYTCPMHPEVRQDKEGICSECGMQLLAQKIQDTRNNNQKKQDTIIKHVVKGKHVGHSTRMFLRKFWVCFLLTLPVALYSELPEKFLGWKAPSFGIWNLEFGISFLLGSIIFVYGGWVFIAGALRELKGKLPGMMTLIAVAISAAYFWSVYAVFFAPGEHTLFWELSTLITIMLLGHWLEMRAVSGAQGALRELSKLLPDTAEIIVQGGKENQNSKSKIQNDNSKSKIETKTVPLSELKIDDIVLVRPGSKVPADGVVVEGESELNEAMVTGESKPVAKTPGSEVIAGTINGDGSLKVKVTKIGENTFLAGVMRLVQEAQASKSRLQILADKAAFYLTTVAVSVGGITLLVWLLLKGDPSFAVSRVVAVLVIACPHALGLAVPLVASISTTLAARHGFLVKQRLALEAARKIDIVLFDKTGTLTKGEFGVDSIVPAQSQKEEEILQYAASVDAFSEHPIARAIVNEAKKRGIQLLPTTDFQRIPGKGAQGRIGENTVYVGSEAILGGDSAMFSDIFRDRVNEIAGTGKTIIYVLREKELLGAVVLADIIREESREAVNALHEIGVKTAMITGDSEEVTKWVAGELGIDEYYARVLPGEKSEIVKRLQNPKHEARNSKQIQNSKFKIQNSYKCVAFVGDGVNDAPALMQADVGIAIGAGTNVALESAGIILVRNDPRDIPKIVRLSRLTYGKMLQNLFWATGYNVAAIPLAAGLLAPWGIFLQPAFAAVLMSLSTVIVAVNALLLRGKKI